MKDPYFRKASRQDGTSAPPGKEGGPLAALEGLQLGVGDSGSRVWGFGV